MSNPLQHEIVGQIASDLVSRVAPHELPLFRATSEAYFRRAARSLKAQGARDEMLGFGAGKEVAFLTPVVLAVTDTVVGFVTAEVGAGRDDDLVRGAFRRYRSASQPAPSLSAAQIGRARQLALQKAHQFNLAEAQAELLADSLVASLADATS